jgi:hypothetical protein
MGVADPECSKISGHAFTASALRNLLPMSCAGNNLELHRSHAPISEYNNPALPLGMFPMLFLFGIAGFDDDTRPMAVSARKQAKYFLDLAVGVFAIIVHTCSSF